MAIPFSGMICISFVPIRELRGSLTRRGGNEPHSSFVLPLMPAERAVRRTRAPIADEHRRRNAGGASASGARRMIFFASGDRPMTKLNFKPRELVPPGTVFNVYRGGEI